MKLSKGCSWDVQELLGCESLMLLTLTFRQKNLGFVKPRKLRRAVLFCRMQAKGLFSFSALESSVFP